MTATHYQPLLTTREAADYLRFRSTSGIRTAISRGELTPCGAGPKCCHMFNVAELDRFIEARGARYARRTSRNLLDARAKIAPPARRA